MEAEDIVLLINCTCTEKLLGTDTSGTNHGLPQGKHENEVFKMFIWDGWQTVWLQAALTPDLVDSRSECVHTLLV